MITDAVAQLVRGGGTRTTLAALTATPEVHKDIQRLLDIDVSDAVVRSPDRPEDSFAERARDYGA